MSVVEMLTELLENSGALFADADRDFVLATKLKIDMGHIITQEDAVQITQIYRRWQSEMYL